MRKWYLFSTVVHYADIDVCIHLLNTETIDDDDDSGYSYS